VVDEALRWDGVFPTGLPGPEALAELVSEVSEARPAGDPFDGVVDIPPGQDVKWAPAGGTGRSLISVCNLPRPRCAR
jgi:hypothetical protein